MPSLCKQQSSILHENVSGINRNSLKNDYTFIKSFYRDDVLSYFVESLIGSRGEKTDFL